MRKDNSSMREAKVMLAMWGCAALYVGMVVGCSFHAWMDFWLGAAAVVGLLVVSCASVALCVLYIKLRKWRESPRARGGAAEPAGNPIRRHARRPSRTIRQGPRRLFHPEEWTLLGNDPDHGSNMWTRASLEASTTEYARSDPYGNRLVMWLVILVLAPFAAGFLIFAPLMLIYPDGVSTWNFVWMDAATSVVLIVALIGGGYAHDRIALRARHKAQLRAALIKHP